MYMRRTAGTLPRNVLFLSVGLFLLVLAGCGTPTTAAGPTSPSATATACAQVTRPASSIKTATGVLKSINGQTLILTDQKGTDVTATYSDSTRFTQTASIAPTSLQSGAMVRVAVTSSNGTYTATVITVLNRTNGTGTGGGFPQFTGTPGTRRGGNNPCAKGTQTANLGTNKGFRGLIGTVGQLSGNTLAITDTTGNTYSVTITPQTQITETQSATAAALKVGVLITVIGKPDSQGVIAASNVVILPNLPTPGTTPGA